MQFWSQDNDLYFLLFITRKEELKKVFILWTFDTHCFHAEDVAGDAIQQQKQQQQQQKQQQQQQ